MKQGHFKIVLPYLLLFITNKKKILCCNKNAIIDLFIYFFYTI